MAGFTHYNEIPSTEPTTAEILASLTNAQKVAVLDGFVANTPIIQLKHEIGVRSFAINHLYTKIDEMEAISRALMRDVTPPSTSGELVTAIEGLFADDFTSAQVTAILTKMVEYSKHDGTGTWAYYSSEVIK
jgi:hypothetical protein